MKNENKNLITRRGFLSLGAVMAGSTLLSGCANNQPQKDEVIKPTSKKLKETLLPKGDKKRVVIVGGGISGMYVANGIREEDKNKEIEIVILERNNQFHSCPGSNILLSKTAIEYANETGAPAQWIFKYHKVKEQFSKNGDIILTGVEVRAGDTTNKILKTTKGNIAYDTLIMATGIEYNYKGQFPKWTPQKIEQCKTLAPAGMIQDGGNEWENMSEKWQYLIETAKNNPNKQYNIVINPTPKSDREGKKSLRRCPPAAGERTTMLASKIKKEGIKNLKVDFLIELDGGLGSKGAAFAQSWKLLGYCKDLKKPTEGDIIRPIFNSRITDVDFNTKTISYNQIKWDEDGLEIIGNTNKTIKYDEAIIMAQQKTPEVINNIFGKEPKLIESGFEVKNLNNHYILGDSQSSHPLPASGSMAMNIATFMAVRVVNQLNGKDTKEDYTQASNVCFSLVGENPNEGIKVEHNIFSSKGILKGKGHVPKINGVFKQDGIAMEQAGWLYGISALYGADGQKPNNVINK